MRLDHTRKQGKTGRRRITPMGRFHTKDMGIIVGIMGNLGLMGRMSIEKRSLFSL